MQPLCITLYLAGNIALARPEDLALDGILSYQALRRHFGEDFYTLPNPKEYLCFARLPLEMRGAPSSFIRHATTGSVWYDRAQAIDDESLWYWACSSAQIAVKGRQTQYWNKRFDTQASLSDHIDFGGRVEKILIENGRYKAYHMPLPTLVCDRVVWYAYGDMEQVADLLTGVHAVAKKRAYGNGSVIRASVQPMAEDWSEWRDHTLMRPIPGVLLKDVQWHTLDMQYIAYRAPQWHPRNHAMCVSKGVRHAA